MTAPAPRPDPRLIGPIEKPRPLREGFRALWDYLRSRR